MQKNLSKSKQALILLLVNVIILGCLFVILEWLMGLWLHNLPDGPTSLLRGFRQYYMNHHRKIIQFQPDFSRYDDELSYTLRPGSFVFRNIEFETPYQVNSLGVRDDEDSLHQSEIVVLGDSHAMGWGVRQEDTFSSVLEKETGKKVLNTAISSYGTVREMKMLKKVDRVGLKYLIIQYCRNDFAENKSFVENDRVLPIMSEKSFNSVQGNHLKQSKYYYGKYTLKLFPFLLKHSVKGMFDDDSEEGGREGFGAEQEAAYFLQVLLHSGVDLKKAQVVVFEMNEYGRLDSLFIQELQKQAMKPEFQSQLGGFQTIDLAQEIQPHFLFKVDDHTNKLNHRHVADRILPHIN